MKNPIYRTTIALTLLVIIFCQYSIAQTKYIDRSGKVQFEASQALFEEVKAINKSVTGILETETGQIAALALIKGFHFKNSLMEEHFNENYMASESYPKATFKGLFSNLNMDTLDENIQKVMVKGTLELHGKAKEIHTPLSLQKIGEIISITGEFLVTPADFDIQIPKIVENKIAKEVLIKIDLKLTKK
ncbi:MAG: YceI family protein [Flavobacteriaceae bacterium]